MSDLTSEDQTAEQPPSIAATMLELLKTKPDADDHPADRVEWWENKAKVLQRVADHPCCPDPAAANSYAENARRKAQAIRDAEAW